jgi:regulator of sirC expression with transglutaminase-like and TPR domain
MSAPSAATPVAPLSPNQRHALLTLLADEDPAVYQTIRSRILEEGAGAESWLRPHALSSDPLLRRRVQEILQHLARHAADTAFLGFCLKHGEDLNIEDGCWHLAQTQYPEINILAYQALLDNFATEVRDQIGNGEPVEGNIAALNEYLFGKLGYHGNETDYYDPENSYLNRVLDRRTGNPISLCLVYLFLARRVGLPIAGIGMPGHFLVRYQASTGDRYIDAFNKGKVLSKADCVKYLIHSTHGFQESFLAPISPRRTLLRICSNLHQIYTRLELPEEQARVQRYVVALAK